MPSVGDPCRLAQPTGQAFPAVRISLAPRAVLLMPPRGHTGHEMHPHGLRALEKAAYKSIPGHLKSNAWCLWVLHECNLHVREKMDFSTCDHKVAFQNTVT